MYMSAQHMGLSAYFPRGMGVTNTQIAETVAAALTPIPIVGQIAQIGAQLFALFSQVFSGCGQTCTLTSQEANQVQTALQQNLAAWNASQKTESEQTAALANFDYAWSQLQKVCGSPSMGNAGVRCLSERQRGGVSHWCCTAPACTASSGPYDSCSVPSSQSCNGGPPCCMGCDYFKVYRDPIANDPNVIPDESAVLPIGSSPTGAVSDSTSTGTVTIGSVSIPTSVLVLAGVGLLAVVVLS